MEGEAPCPQGGTCPDYQRREASRRFSLMTTYFTADLHLGHANIIRYCDRPFADAGEMDAALLNNLNAVVRQEDTLYVLGDFCMGNDAAAYRRRIACRDVVLT